MEGFSYRVVEEHVHFIVENTYLMNDKSCIRKQEIGLPMGTNAAPELANLCLFTDEYKYIDSLVNSNRIDEAKALAYMHRYIDDILTWDVQPPPQHVYGLEYIENLEDDGSVIYLGAKIKTKNNHLSMSFLTKLSNGNFQLPSILIGNPISLIIKLRAYFYPKYYELEAYAILSRISKLLFNV